MLWYSTCIAFNKGIVALSIPILFNLLDVGSPVYFSVWYGHQLTLYSLRPMKGAVGVRQKLTGYLPDNQGA